jgi:hypothetical protein
MISRRCGGDGGGEGQEDLVDLVADFPADAQATEPVQQAIAGSIIHRCASRHLLQVAARAEVRPSFGLWTDSAHQGIRAPG